MAKTLFAVCFLAIALYLVAVGLYKLYRLVIRENLEDVKVIREETEVYLDAKRAFDDAVVESKRKRK